MRCSILVLEPGPLVGASSVLAADYPAKTLDLSKPYAFSRRKRLELSAFTATNDETDMRERHVGSWVWVGEKERTVFVTPASVAGREPITASAAEGCVATARAALCSLSDSISTQES